MTSTTVRNSLIALGIYGGLVLLFTLISLQAKISPGDAGHFRSLDAIPSHLVLLASGGILLALVSSAVFKRLDVRLVVLIPSFVVLTDLDHLPSALDITQPIRPAHSFFFVLAAFVFIALATRDASLSFAALAGFFAHIGIDTGEFPFLSPFSFRDYYTSETLQIAFLVIGLASAIAAGYLSTKTTQSGERAPIDLSGSSRRLVELMK